MLPELNNITNHSTTGIKVSGADVLTFETQIAGSGSYNLEILIEEFGNPTAKQSVSFGNIGILTGENKYSRLSHTDSTFVDRNKTYVIFYRLSGYNSTFLYNSGYGTKGSRFFVKAERLAGELA